MKNQNQENRSISDLIVCHSEQHLEKRSHFKLWTYLLKLPKIFPQLFFAFVGIVVMLAAFYIVNVESPTFISEDVTDYSLQQNFYLNEGEKMHAAARMKIHEVAIAMELSRVLNFIGLFLILGVLWYLHEKHGVFNKNRANFIVRKIR